MKEVLVIIPSYNEELNIAGVLDGLLQYKEEVDILVVDDGSSDHTASIVREYPVFLVSHPCNLGYGFITNRLSFCAAIWVSLCDSV